MLHEWRGRLFGIERYMKILGYTHSHIAAARLASRKLAFSLLTSSSEDCCQVAIRKQRSFLLDSRVQKGDFSTEFTMTRPPLVLLLLSSSSESDLSRPGWNFMVGKSFSCVSISELGLLLISIVTGREQSRGGSSHADLAIPGGSVGDVGEDEGCPLCGRFTKLH